MASEISELSSEEKQELAISWLNRGEKVTVVAKRLGVTPKTVYTWRHKEREELISELETLRHIDVFAEQLEALSEYEDACLRLFHRIGQDEEIYDPDTNKMVFKRGSHRDASEFMRLVRDFRTMKINLLTTVGIIPKQPEKIYQTLSDAQTLENQDEVKSLSRDQLSDLVLKKVSQQYILR